MKQGLAKVTTATFDDLAERPSDILKGRETKNARMQVIALSDN